MLRWECCCILKLVIQALSLMFCHLQTVSLISIYLVVYRKEHGFFFKKKRRMNCVAIIILSVSDHHTKSSDVNHYENKIVCKKMINFADFEYLLNASPGLCNQGRQCVILFTHSVNMNMLSLKK